MPKPTEALEPITMCRGESIGYVVDFTPWLDADETIESCSVAAVSGKVDASEESPNGSEITKSGVTIATGKGVTMTLDCVGGDDGAQVDAVYDVVVTIVTSKDDTMKQKTKVRVDG